MERVRLNLDRGRTRYRERETKEKTYMGKRLSFVTVCIPEFREVEGAIRHTVIRAM